MRIPNSVYPSNYFGEIGIAHCCECGTELSLDDEAIQDEWDNQFYCERCHEELEMAREEAEEEIIEQQMELDLLKKLFDDFLKKGREYFMGGLDDVSLKEFSRATHALHSVNEEIHHIADWARFMVIDDRYTFKQCYEVIELLTGVKLDG